jgi:hypothetical protein
MIANRLAAELDNEIQHGIFAGMRLSSLRWGGHDRAPMILGLYESEVNREIEKSASHATIFIDIGAADGYFAVGAVFSGLYKESICFEISEEGRESIAKNAERNGVLDKTTILAEANEDSLLSTVKGVASNELFVLCDIEGGEFDLFTIAVLKALKSATILIEIHDFSKSDCDKYRMLKLLAGSIFDVHEVTQEARNPNLLEKTRMIHDDDKWLMMSEGRSKAMTWLLLIPRPQLS